MHADEPRRLGDDLALRPMRPGDAPELAAFATRVFGLEDGEPDATAGIWAAELLRPGHPTAAPGDGIVAVERATGRTVGCCFLIGQVWTYAGVPLPVGRPELIATDPSVRGRGVAGAMLGAVHARGAALGHAFQALTGIPYYYRRHGYEPGLLTPGERRGPISAIPRAPAGSPEPVALRPATSADVPLIARLYARAAARSHVAAVRDEAVWRHELLTRDPGSDDWHELRIVVGPGGEAIGVVASLPRLRDGYLSVTLAELTDDACWPELAPAVLRALRALGEGIARRDGAELRGIAFGWTPDHPLLRAAPAAFPDAGKPFAWYVRIPDTAALLRRIAPVLEARLAASPCAGETGELAITTYPRGLRLRFDGGRIAAIEELPSLSHRRADAGLPPAAWQQLLFGCRTPDELEQANPFEARFRSDRARVLLAALFPTRPSVVWPIA